MAPFNNSLKTSYAEDAMPVLARRGLLDHFAQSGITESNSEPIQVGAVRGFEFRHPKRHSNARMPIVAFVEIQNSLETLDILTMETLSAKWINTITLSAVEHWDAVQKYSNLMIAESVSLQIVRELGRLSNGWAGQHSVAPTPQVLRDLQRVAACFPPKTRMPEVEVDPEDGSVILRWSNEAFSQTFSLTFLGRGDVTGFHASRQVPEPAWKYRVADASKLAIHLSDESIQAILTE